jgi:hypothetical protein
MAFALRYLSEWTCKVIITKIFLLNSRGTQTLTSFNHGETALYFLTEIVPQMGSSLTWKKSKQQKSQKSINWTWNHASGKPSLGTQVIRHSNTKLLHIKCNSINQRWLEGLSGVPTSTTLILTSPSRGAHHPPPPSQMTTRVSGDTNIASWAVGWMIGGSSPGRGYEFFSPPPRTDRLWASTQPSNQWVPGALPLGGKVAGA